MGGRGTAVPTTPRAAAEFGGTPRRAAVTGAMSDPPDEPPPTTPPGTGPERDAADEPPEVLEAGCDPRVLGLREGTFTELGPLRPSDPDETEPPPLDPPELPALAPPLDPLELEEPAEVRGTAWPCARAGTARDRLTPSANASRGKRVMADSRGPGKQTSA